MFSRVTVGKEITAKKGEPDHMPKPHAVIVAGCIYGLPTPLSEKPVKNSWMKENQPTRFIHGHLLFIALRS